MRHGVMNGDVRKELAGDFALFVLFTTRMGEVDSDIHPTHNKDWVQDRLEREANLLVEAKLELGKARQAWEKVDR